MSDFDGRFDKKAHQNKQFDDGKSNLFSMLDRVCTRVSSTQGSHGILVTAVTRAEDAV